MDSIHKFQDLLKGLFQFETSDLDFGIYRILNYKRGLIRKFIQDDLVNKVESAFAKYKDERLTNINERFEEARKKVIEELNPDVFTPTGNLKEEFKNTGVGRKYLSIKEQKDEAQTIDEITIKVFNDLYSFFSRFYEEGDFVPQYRYSIKGHKYAIPYDGDEVKLYWANSEQYYTKTGLLFRDYTFKANNYKIIFRIVSAREELGSTKATRARFFVLDDGNPVELNEKVLIIRFQYREFTEEEVISYEVGGGSNTSKQEKINQRSYKEILEEIKDIELGVGLGRDYKNEKPLLRYQISRFTAKNTKDYFIHKNLKKFLSEQLDFFIKAEVLSIETLEKEKFLDKHITRAKVVREIGEDIVDFLSQIEDFQKRLWEKKKFVLKTEYVITTDRVPEEFYNEIWNNKEQKKEWKELGFDLPKTKGELKKTKLPTDTKYFNQEFKENLLEKLTEKADLDELLDGLLIKSENWQGLNILMEKYRGKVKCTYIDPPYNSKTTEILYRNFYKHSSWLSLMENRLSLSKHLSTADGSHVIAIDENEQEGLSFLLSMVFPEHQKICVAVVHNKKGIQGDYFSYNHDYAFFCIPPGLKEVNQKPIAESEWTYDNLRKWGNESERTTAKNCFYPIIIEGNNIVDFGDVCSDSSHPGISNKKREDGTIEVYPVDTSGVERKWRYARGSVERIRHLLKVHITNKGEVQVLKAKNSIQYKTVWDDAIYIAGDYGTRLLTEMGIFPENNLYPKSIYTVRDSIHAVSNDRDIILDFFAGTGTTAHAVMELNKEDGGKRKYIIVEMANYFDIVLIPRLKKICYSFNWKGGQPQDTDGTSQFFKYQILEQYEDALDNIELRENKQAELKFGDDYLLKYFLDYETRENPSLLNIDNLKNPFSYKLRVNLEEVGEPQEMVVDIPETFNYLLGLKVKKAKTRNNGRKYLFILGEKEGKDIAIIWREYDDKWNENDFKKDKQFIIREITPWIPHIVYVNGQSVLTPKLGERPVEIRYIEPEFKRLMEV